ncbi:MAG TPA: hypothetical protein VG929_06665, partial [Actinomycetota bacterium]|nr:hypothetical protein [Actinomycetota bacterium]
QPSSPTAAEAPAPRAGVPAQVGLGDIKEAWAVTLAELKKSSVRVAAMLNPSRPIAFTDGVLDVEVQSAYHADEMSAVGNRSLLADALHAALGVRPDIRFAARGTTHEPADEPTDAAAAVEDAVVVTDDPVELVRRGLGAEVIEEKTN